MTSFQTPNFVQKFLESKYESLLNTFAGSAIGVAQIWMQILFKMAQIWMLFSKLSF